VFTDSDVEALEIGESMIKAGIIEPEIEIAVTRALGQHLSRLAEWQVHMLWTWINDQSETPRSERQVARLVDRLVPELERLQNYVWRRQLAAYAGRALASPGDDLDSATRVVGFVDMVGYTRLTRRVDEARLSEVLDRFETIAAEVIAERHGRVVKMIGDEVLFVADTEDDAAEIALALNERAAADDDMPDLRTGMATGRVLSRFGDVYGAVVNLAARLTSVARPGSILVDKDFADALEDRQDYSLRARRTVSVRGYHRLRPYSLRRSTARKPSTTVPGIGLLGTGQQFAADLLGISPEVQTAATRPAAGARLDGYATAAHQGPEEEAGGSTEFEPGTSHAPAEPSSAAGRRQRPRKRRRR
jgi:adenylate cyclase